MILEIIPILRVKDGEVSAEWYARLGFRVEFRHRFSPHLPLFVGLAQGISRVFLSEHLGDARPGTLLQLSVDDAAKVGAAFEVPVEAQPWGLEVRLTDPDGNRLRVVEYPAIGS